MTPAAARISVIGVPPSTSHTIGAAAHDHGHLGERLDVLHERRPAAQAPLGETDDPVGGHTGAPGHTGDERRGLAPDETVIGHVQPDDRGIPPFAQGLLDRESRIGMHHEVGLVGTQRLSADQQSVDDQVRGALQQHTILRAERLALAAVADDDRGPAADRGPSDGGEFAVDGESGPAAPLQPRALELAEETVEGR